MRLLPFALVLVLVGCTDDGIPVPAQADDPAPVAIEADPAAPADTAVTAFFARFQAAVRRGEESAVEAMINFPVEGLGADRDAFRATYYPMLFADGAFRDRLLAASPRALEADGEGGYTFQALVTGCDDGDDGTDCESAAVYTFRRDAEGRWRVADVHLAG